MVIFISENVKDSGQYPIKLPLSRILDHATCTTTVVVKQRVDMWKAEDGYLCNNDEGASSATLCLLYLSWQDILLFGS